MVEPTVWQSEQGTAQPAERTGHAWNLWKTWAERLAARNDHADWLLMDGRLAFHKENVLEPRRGVNRDYSKIVPKFALDDYDLATSFKEPKVKGRYELDDSDLAGLSSPADHAFQSLCRTEAADDGCTASIAIQKRAHGKISRAREDGRSYRHDGSGPAAQRDACALG